jgi:protein phosphatase
MKPSFTAKIATAFGKIVKTGRAVPLKARCGSARAAEAAPVRPVGLLDCFGMTDRGKVRPSNEDQFLIGDLARSIADCPLVSSLGPSWDAGEMARADLLLVADGVGGCAGGERASRLAVEEVVECLHACRHELRNHASCTPADVLSDLTTALFWAAHCIQREAAANPAQSRMGTTLTLAYLNWPMAFVAHAGDSRAYVYRPGELVQITQDQTWAQLLASAGVIQSDQVESHPMRNVLASLLSPNHRQLTPQVHQRELSPGDQLLLCTDGLTKSVAADQIAEILNCSLSAEEACRELVAAANGAGGSDNITVVLARFGYREIGSTVRFELPADFPAA